MTAARSLSVRPEAVRKRRQRALGRQGGIMLWVRISNDHRLVEMLINHGWLQWHESEDKREIGLAGDDQIADLVGQLEPRDDRVVIGFGEAGMIAADRDDEIAGVLAIEP